MALAAGEGVQRCWSSGSEVYDPVAASVGNPRGLPVAPPVSQPLLQTGAPPVRCPRSRLSDFSLALLIEHVRGVVDHRGRNHSSELEPWMLLKKAYFSLDIVMQDLFSLFSKSGASPRVLFKIKGRFSIHSV